MSGFPSPTRAGFPAHGPGAGRGTSGRSDDGSATVWLLAVLFLLMWLAGVAFTLTTIGAVRARAATAADLAALAAAGLPPAGAETACAQAGRVSELDGAHLVGCRIVADAVEVTVRVPLPLMFGLRASVTSTARAGPWARAPGVYQPVSRPGDGRPAQDRTLAGVAVSRAVDSADDVRLPRARSATRATMRSPRRAGVTGCG
ncbi:flp pilus-assembly TadE/G-like family protein [Frankia sp. Ag45/Mut15]|uniref:Flp pilus-assembly TadE/G-like family protein n=1 Tax=Frankia umida TaxID=573489 RepID=A0ABT0JS02_9ACTN|nr:Rv3654c family TadE-like protein [Frankia umida]MCK9874327.1 flp pilus-assembly TadE/G-like family protein [Frankia umida]